MINSKKIAQYAAIGILTGSFVAGAGVCFNAKADASSNLVYTQSIVTMGYTSSLVNNSSIPNLAYTEIDDADRQTDTIDSLEDTMVDTLENTIETQEEVVEDIVQNNDRMSFQRAQEIANELGVPLEYVIGLNLPASYEIGGRIIPEGMTPQDISYAGENGLPVLAIGFPNTDPEEICAYKLVAGEEINFFRRGYIEDDEFSPYHYTWYSPRTAGYHVRINEWYSSDDGFFRDEDGYLVLAKTGYKNAVNDPTQEHVYATPFGLGKVHDSCGMGDNWIDIYVDDRKGLTAAYGRH